MVYSLLRIITEKSIIIITPVVFYLGGKISGAEVKEMLPHTMRLILFAWLPTLIITTYVPDLSLFLPRLFGYC